MLRAAIGGKPAVQLLETRAPPQIALGLNPAQALTRDGFLDRTVCVVVVRIRATPRSVQGALDAAHGLLPIRHAGAEPLEEGVGLRDGGDRGGTDVDGHVACANGVLSLPVRTAGQHQLHEPAGLAAQGAADQAAVFDRLLEGQGLHAVPVLAVEHRLEMQLPPFKMIRAPP